MSEPTKTLLAILVTIASLGLTTIVMAKHALFLLFWAVLMGSKSPSLGPIGMTLISVFFLVAPWILIAAAWMFSTLFLAANQRRKAVGLSLAPTIVMGLASLLIG